MLSNEDESLRIPYSSVFLPCFAHKSARKNKKGKRNFFEREGGGGVSNYEEDHKGDV